MENNKSFCASQQAKAASQGMWRCRGGCISLDFSGWGCSGQRGLQPSNLWVSWKGERAKGKEERGKRGEGKNWYKSNKCCLRDIRRVARLYTHIRLKIIYQYLIQYTLILITPSWSQSVGAVQQFFLSFPSKLIFTGSPSLCLNNKGLRFCQLESFGLLSYFSVSIGNIFNENSLFSIAQACARSHRMKSFPKHLLPERTIYSKLGYLPAFQKVICWAVLNIVFPTWVREKTSLLSIIILWIISNSPSSYNSFFSLYC